MHKRVSANAVCMVDGVVDSETGKYCLFLICALWQVAMHKLKPRQPCTSTFCFSCFVESIALRNVPSACLSSSLSSFMSR